MTTTIDRTAVRIKAERHWDEQLALIRAGKSPYQLSIDQSDEVRALSNNMPADKSAAYLAMYFEEQEAIRRRWTDEVQKATEEMSRKAAKNDSLVTVFITVLSLLSLYVLFQFFIANW